MQSELRHLRNTCDWWKQGSKGGVKGSHPDVKVCLSMRDKDQGNAVSV